VERSAIRSGSAGLDFQKGSLRFRFPVCLSYRTRLATRALVIMGLRQKAELAPVYLRDAACIVRSVLLICAFNTACMCRVSTQITGNPASARALTAIATAVQLPTQFA